MDRISPSEGGDAGSIPAEDTFMFLFLMNLFSLSFLLNFVWEISQMGFYSTAGMGDLSDYWNFVSIHWQVSVKDALMVVAMYVAISLFLKNWNWIRTWNAGWAILLVSLPVWQAVIEYYSVHVYGRWGYATSMPLIYGIGVLPLLQMLVLPAVAVLLSRRLIKE